MGSDSVFPFDLTATVVAIKIAVALDAYNCRIHTDCQSVQKLLTAQFAEVPEQKGEPGSTPAGHGRHRTH